VAVQMGRSVAIMTTLPRRSHEYARSPSCTGEHTRTMRCVRFLDTYVHSTQPLPRHFGQSTKNFTIYKVQHFRSTARPAPDTYFETSFGCSLNAAQARRSCNEALLVYQQAVSSQSSRTHRGTERYISG
jgi:hypothetical protein